MNWPRVKSFSLKVASATVWLRWRRRQSAPTPRLVNDAATSWNERALPNPFFEGLAG